MPFFINNIQDISITEVNEVKDSEFVNVNNDIWINRNKNVNTVSFFLFLSFELNPILRDSFD